MTEVTHMVYVVVTGLGYCMTQGIHPSGLRRFVSWVHFGIKPPTSTAPRSLRLTFHFRLVLILWLRLVGFLCPRLFIVLVETGLSIVLRRLVLSSGFFRFTLLLSIEGCELY
jgi:hypothetical protein